MMRTTSPWKPYLSDRFTSPTERLVGALADDILLGRLESGARLPAHRALADELGVAVGTVTKAYGILERRGLVRIAKGSATFVALTEAQTGPLIDLSRNAPPAGVTSRLLSRTLGALAKRVDSAYFNDYPPLGGHREHRRQLARWFTSIGMETDPALLLLTAGAHHALSLAMVVACGRGGTLLTETQTYPGAIALARHHGVRLIGIETDGEGMLPDALAETLKALHGEKTAVYVTPTMHNPSTATMGMRRREAIVAVCRVHNVEIIEDDVYNLGIDPRLAPLAMLAPERTFYANSMSKSLNPTLRIGGLVVPTGRLGAAEEAFKAMSILVSPLSCAVMEQWLLDGTAEAVSQAIRHESARRMAVAHEALGDLLSFPNYPGYHLWLPMRREEAERLHQAASSFGIVLTPPSATAVSPEAQDSGIRLCIGTAPLADLRPALATIARLQSTVPGADVRAGLMY